MGVGHHGVFQGHPGAGGERPAQGLVPGLGQPHQVEVGPHQEPPMVLRALRGRWLRGRWLQGGQDEHVGHQGAVDARGPVVAGGAPHAVVDPHRGGDLRPGVPEAEEGGGGGDDRGAHGRPHGSPRRGDRLNPGNLEGLRAAHGEDDVGSAGLQAGEEGAVAQDVDRLQVVHQVPLGVDVLPGDGGQQVDLPPLPILRYVHTLRGGGKAAGGLLLGEGEQGEQVVGLHLVQVAVVQGDAGQGGPGADPGPDAQGLPRGSRGGRGVGDPGGRPGLANVEVPGAQGSGGGPGHARPPYVLGFQVVLAEGGLRGGRELDDEPGPGVPAGASGSGTGARGRVWKGPSAP